MLPQQRRAFQKAIILELSYGVECYKREILYRSRITWHLLVRFLHFTLNVAVNHGYLLYSAVPYIDSCPLGVESSCLHFIFFFDIFISLFFSFTFFAFSSPLALPFTVYPLSFLVWSICFPGSSSP